MFVSSTFRDMIAERDLLAKEVFPDLRQRCNARGVEFVEVDLRWGVTEEAAEDGAVLPICLREIENCRPFFVALLGQRYGTVLDARSPDLLEQYPWLKFHAARSITELEILHGAVLNIAAATRALFYFRSPGYVANVPIELRRNYVAEDDESAGKLEQLKARIREAGFSVVEDYATPEAVAERVHRDLIQAIEADFPERIAFDPDDAEQWRHEAFGTTHRTQFVGGSEALDAIDRHVDQGRRVCLLGAPGTGKSAILANWTSRLRRRVPEAFVFEHYVGSTSRSADPEALATRLVRTLDRRFDLRLSERSSADPMEQLATALERAAALSRVILVLDGLDRLTDRDNAPDLMFLPTSLPSNMAIVSSSCAGRPADAARRRGWAVVELPPLSRGARKQFVVAYLHDRYRKVLSPHAVQRIAAADQASTPLHLRLILEELRLCGDHELIDEHIERLVQAGTLVELFERVLERYEADFERERPGLVGETLALLWAARRGLSEQELLGLLRQDGRPLQMRYWSSLLLALKDSLVVETDVIAMASDHARNAVARRYLAQPDARRAVHARLAKYVAAAEGERRLDELPWQLVEAELRDELKALITSPEFLMPMVAAGRLEELRRFWLYLGAAPDMARALVTSFADLTKRRPVPDGAIRYGTRLGSFLGEQAHHGEAMEILAETLALSERTHGWDHPETAECAKWLGAEARESGDIEASRQLLYRAHAVHQVSFGEDHELAVRSAIGIANLFAESNAPDQAEILLQRARSSLSQSKRTGVLMAVVLDNLGGLHQGAGRYDVADACYRDALAVFERECGPSHRDTAVCLDKLAGGLVAQHRHDEAERVATRALSIWQALSGRDDRDACVSLALLGRIAIARGDLARAGELQQRVAVVRQRTLGAEHPDTRSAQKTLDELIAAAQEAPDPGVLLQRAVVAEHCGDIAEAEKLFQQTYELGQGQSGPHAQSAARAAFRIAERRRRAGRIPEAAVLYREALRVFEESPDNAFDVSECLFGLADLHLAEGDNDAARAASDRALQIAQTKLGANSDYMPRAYGRLGNVTRALGDLETAEEHLRLAVRLADERYPVDDPRRHAPMNNLATVLSERGDHQGAAVLHRRVLADRERVLGLEHPVTAISLSNLAATLTELGELDEARTLMQRALDVYIRKIGANSRETAESHRQFGEILRRMRRFDEAVPHLRRALEGLRSTLGERHRSTVTCMSVLADVLAESGDDSGAEAVLRQRLAVFERAVEAEHPLLAQPLTDLARTASRLGKHDEAEALFRRALVIIETAQGADHTDTAMCCQLLGAELRRKGTLEPAAALMSRALAIFEKALGPMHFACGAALDDLGDLHVDADNSEAAEQAYRRAITVLDAHGEVGRPRLEGALRSLASLLGHARRYDEAAATYARVVVLREARSQPDDPLLALDLNEQAKMLIYGKHPDAARPLAQRAWQILNEARRRRDPRAMFGFCKWAGVCEDVGQANEAVSNYQIVVELFETSSDEAVVAQPAFMSMAARSYASIARLRDIGDGNWRAAERRLRTAVDLYTRIGKHTDAADAELSMQLIARRSGSLVDRARVQELCAVLERAGDVRAARARELLDDIAT